MTIWKHSLLSIVQFFMYVTVLHIPVWQPGATKTSAVSDVCWINVNFVFFYFLWCVGFFIIKAFFFNFVLFLVYVCVKWHITSATVTKQKGANGCTAFKVLFINGFLHF